MSEFEAALAFLNEEFMKSLTGALIGAGAGALAAQYIVERSKQRDDFIKEIRNLNAAVTIAYSITNTFINTKRQIVKPLIEEFDAAHASFLEASKMGGDGRTIVYPVSLQTFTLTRSPIAQLQEIIINRMSAPTRALSVVVMLDRTLHGLERFIDERNALMGEFRENGVSPFVYFGIKVSSDGGDARDARYANLIHNMASETDNAIYFSKLLADDLVKYARSLKDKQPRRSRVTAPIVVSADFSAAADAMPDPARYKSWETSFVPSKNKDPLLTDFA